MAKYDEPMNPEMERLSTLEDKFFAIAEMDLADFEGEEGRRIDWLCGYLGGIFTEDNWINLAAEYKRLPNGIEVLKKKAQMEFEQAKDKAAQ